MKKIVEGDTVFCLNNLNLWNNPYHYKTFLNSFARKVVLSNEERFTVNKKVKDLGAVTDKSFDSLDTYYQNGWCIDYANFPEHKVFSLENPKHNEFVLSKLNEAFEKAHQQALAQQQIEIEEIERDIAKLQTQLALVKQGKNRNPNRKSPLEVNEEFKQAILAKLA